MSTFCRVFCRFAVVTPVLVASLSRLEAQAVERSTGTHEQVAVSPNPTRLVASLTPSDTDLEVNGCVTFGLAEKGLLVSGRLDGLDPNKSYRLIVDLPEADTLDVVKEPRGDNSTAAKGNPVIPRDDASSRTNGDLGIVLADANGAFDVRMTLNGASLADGERGIMGRSVILMEIPAEGAGGAPVQVASAVVKLPAQGGAAIERSRLDELGPGERWF